ncbi:MAG: hypothetical protein HC895_22885 [Leptolyngbyaceae cyanobacterium SM1_3_5]|nr:hypothetical protein [Leptolyngbyaceae cyanobacterium SM1_3_5]
MNGLLAYCKGIQNWSEKFRSKFRSLCQFYDWLYQAIVNFSGRYSDGLDRHLRQITEFQKPILLNWWVFCKVKSLAAQEALPYFYR